MSAPQGIMPRKDGADRDAFDCAELRLKLFRKNGDIGDVDNPPCASTKVKIPLRIDGPVLPDGQPVSAAP